MDNSPKPPVILSFCPGILGLERGLTRAIGRVNVAAYAEIEAFIIANLISGMEEGILAPAPVWSDLKTFPARQFHGKINGIIGGYPCQPFSNAGNRLGTDDPRHLFPFIRNHIEASGPSWCWFENVRGHLRMGYDTVYRSLREAGYAVECGLYSAEETGAPHKRERLFILAVKLADRDCLLELERLANNRREYALGSVTAGGDYELADANSDGYEQQVDTVRPGRDSAIAPGQKLGDAYGNRNNSEREYRDIGNGSAYTQQRRNSLDKPAEPGLKVADPGSYGFYSPENGESPVTGKNGNETREDAIFEPSRRGNPSLNGEMADPGSYGLQGQRGHIGGEFGETKTTIKRGEFNRTYTTAWPSRPGEPQNAWERPRTTKSGLGCTINGYNFREDLLRALGNSVVEQTAEIAFLDLLDRHLTNLIL